MHCGFPVMGTFCTTFNSFFNNIHLVDHQHHVWDIANMYISGHYFESVENFVLRVGETKVGLTQAISISLLLHDALTSDKGNLGWLS
jgi:hypothetical protein